MWEVQQCFSRKFTTERILPVAVNRGPNVSGYFFFLFGGGAESSDAAALEFGIMNRIKRVTLSMMVYIVKCVMSAIVRH